MTLSAEPPSVTFFFYLASEPDHTPPVTLAVPETVKV